MMILTNDIEGAICDECGNRVGPRGCCADARGREMEIERLRAIVREMAERAAVDVERAREQGRIDALGELAETRKAEEARDKGRRAAEAIAEGDVGDVLREFVRRDRAAQAAVDAELAEIKARELAEDLGASNRRAWKWGGLAEWFATGLTVREWA